MWLLLYIVLLMIRVIIGNTDVENTNRVQPKLVNLSQITVPGGIDIYDSNLLRSPTMSYFATTEEDNRHKVVHKRSAEESSVDLWNSLQRSEISSDDSSLYLMPNERDLKSSVPDTPQEKNPAFDLSSGKRIAPSRSKTQRSIHTPFYSWGGKRAEEYADDKAYFLTSKRDKSFPDKDSKKKFLEYAKRILRYERADRTPFFSWGGKRSAEIEFNTDENVDDDIEGKIDLYLSENKFSDNMIESIPGSTENGKNGVEVKNTKFGTSLNSWRGKGNAIKDYWSPRSKELSSFDDTMEKNINNIVQLPIPGKRTINEYIKKILSHYFNEKHGSNVEGKSLPDPSINIRAIKGRQPFFSWGG